MPAPSYGTQTPRLSYPVRSKISAMARPAEQVLKEALQLPEDERAGLVRDLLDSFDTSARPDRTEREWVSEVERRARAATAGEPGLSWEEVRSGIERRLAGD
jgi:putative addiction module component (TIGR02574 family)